MKFSFFFNQQIACSVAMITILTTLQPFENTSDEAVIIQNRLQVLMLVVITLNPRTNHYPKLIIIWRQLAHLSKILFLLALGQEKSILDNDNRSISSPTIKKNQIPKKI